MRVEEKKRFNNQRQEPKLNVFQPKTEQIIEKQTEEVVSTPTTEQETTLEKQPTEQIIESKSINTEVTSTETTEKPTEAIQEPIVEVIEKPIKTISETEIEKQLVIETVVPKIEEPTNTEKPISEEQQLIHKAKCALWNKNLKYEYISDKEKAEIIKQYSIVRFKQPMPTEVILQSLRG